MKLLRKLLHDWFTGPCNDNFEAGRFLWFISVLCALAFAGWHLKTNGQFSITEFGTGVGALLALGGGGIAAKDIGAKKGRSE